MIKIIISFLICLIYSASSQDATDYGCPTSEKFSDCAQPKSCLSCANPRICPTFTCTKGCNCIKGYLRNKEGNCIPRRQCPKPMTIVRRCPNNETFNNCSQPKACVTCVNPRNCPTFTCTKGCDCIEGHFRNDVGNCVPWNECRTQIEQPCPNNEIFSNCSQPAACMTCVNPRKCQTFTCTNGCDCIEGYYRNDAGKCVPWNECRTQIESRCPQNEIYSNCAQPKVCMTCKNPEICPTFTCSTGCNCLPGYFRNSEGICIPQNECPGIGEQCGEDETFYKRTPNCKNTCENFGNPGVRCSFGPPGCFCKEGLVKRKDGKCVKNEDCKIEIKCNKTNEEYSECGSGCAKTCENLNKDISCAAVCVQGCFCTGGLIRNSNGDCVPEEECYQGQEEYKCPDNEQVVPCSKPKWCNTCAIRGNCKLEQCEIGCDCAPNYYRNEEGICIPETYCAPSYY